MRLDPKNVDPVEKPPKLTARHGQHSVAVLAGPRKAVLLEPLLPQDEAVALPDEELHLVAASVAEGEDVGREGIERQLLGDDDRQPADLLAEVDGLATEMHAHRFIGSHYNRPSELIACERSPQPSMSTPFGSRARHVACSARDGIWPALRKWNQSLS